MSTVLDIDGLLESPLADLHAIAGELDIEGYRTLRKSDLTIAILVARGATADAIRPDVTAKHEQLTREKAERERAEAEREEAEQAAREEEREAGDGRSSSGRSRGRRGRRGGRGRSRGGERAGVSAEGGSDDKDSGRAPRQRSGRRRGGSDEQPGRGEKQGGQDKQDGRSARKEQPTTPLSGVFEPGSGGGGRLRTDLSQRVHGDADVPRGEVRRWHLHRGDIINAQVRKSRRGRTDFVVASIDDVNGRDFEASKKKPEPFERHDAAAPAGGWAKRLFKHAPVGPGSRLVVTGATRAAGSEMLKKLAGELGKAGVVTTLVIVSARPEQSETINGVEVLLGDATKSPDGILPALELVLERDKRLAEAGRQTALLVDGLDLLEAEKAAQIFNSARNLTAGGALTVAAACGGGSQLEALATSIGVVATGRRLKIDKKASWSSLR